MGKSVNPNATPAIDQPVAWTWKNSEGARVFFTTIGHPEDFRVESFQRLVINAIHWELGKPVPKTWKGKNGHQCSVPGNRELRYDSYLGKVDKA